MYVVICLFPHPIWRRAGFKLSCHDAVHFIDVYVFGFGKSVKHHSLTTTNHSSGSGDFGVLAFTTATLPSCRVTLLKKNLTRGLSPIPPPPPLRVSYRRVRQFREAFSTLNLNSINTSKSLINLIYFIMTVSYIGFGSISNNKISQ